MTKGRDTQAERLSDIVALIRSRRQTGLLSVERFEAGQFEEGELYFQNGLPVQARLGTLSSQEALTRLMGWRSVYFLFTKDTLTTVQNPQNPQTPPISNFPRIPSSLPATPSPSVNTGPLQRTFPTIQRTPRDTEKEIAARIPRKLIYEQNVLALPLTRQQRSLYMLVDGQRTLADLARFTQKSLQEIYTMLRELQKQGLIAL